MNIAQLWDTLVDCICRPPRDRYTEQELYGGESKRFPGGYRDDVELENKHGQKLQCSHFIPAIPGQRRSRMPCVIYCHCNSGSRKDGEEIVFHFLPQGISVFSLDFAGSGLSDGEWVSLGAREVDDLEAVVNHLRTEDKVSTIALWGRSMGAVTALLYSKRDPSIAGMVLDSPFCKLTDLMLELVQEQQVPIPRPFVKVALAAMRRSVRKRAGFDIQQVAPFDTVHESFVPVLFGHADGDTFVKKSHSEKLFEKYAGDKRFINFKGDHNSRRPPFFYDSASIFLRNVLHVNGQSSVAEAPRDQFTELASRLGRVEVRSPEEPATGMGQTNVPWDPNWAGRSPTVADFDDMLWAAAARGEGEDSDRSLSRDGERSSSQAETAGLDDAWVMPHWRNGARNVHPAGVGEDWFGLLPGSEAAEDAMLQAALEASLAEANLSKSDKEKTVDKQDSSVGQGDNQVGRVKSEAEAIAEQVDLLHQELGDLLTAEPSQPPTGQPHSTNGNRPGTA